ncbi:hypothetical protein BASA81_006652 [Batrachochytrium salamandrivorans]|nr:hypothetical protein BASA81_006652 [Batrachochytrium salamandrivorans]
MQDEDEDLRGQLGRLNLAAPAPAAAAPKSDAILALETSIATLTSSIATITNNIDTLTNDIAALTNDISTCKEELKTAETNVATCSDKVKTLPPGEEKDKVTAEREAYIEQVATLGKTLTHLREDKDNKTNDLLKENNLLNVRRLEMDHLLKEKDLLKDNLLEEKDRENRLLKEKTQLLDKEKKEKKKLVQIPADKLSKNFFNKHQGRGHIQLIKFAKACLEAFRADPQQFFAAYVSFVQSSGYGKTRTLMEAAKHEYLVYVCARKTPRAGFPYRSSNACDFLKLNDDDWNPKRASAPEAIFELSLRVLAIYKSALKLKKQKAADQFKGNCVQFWDEAAQYYQDLKTKGTDKTISSLVKQENLNNQAFVMLAIDEASTLLDLNFPGGRTVFRALRATTRRLQEAGVRIVLVLTDTYLQPSSFLPQIHFDSSLRPTQDIEDETKAHKRFPPFILRTSFDALREGNDKLGRPFVAEHAADSKCLQQKLLGASSFDNASRDGLLAAVLVRVAVSISAQSRVSERLVASHMGTLLSVSFDRESLLVTYLSEPALAAAASLLWRKHLPSLLSTLREALVCGAVSAGPVSVGPAGEIAAQVALLVAFDSLCGEDSGLKRTKPLADFLEALLPADSQLKAAEFIPEEHRKGAQVSVLQFVQLPVNFEFTEAVLKELHARQTACVLPPDQAGLLVPYALPDDKYSFVLVQVENWAVDFAETLRKLDPEFVFGGRHVFAKKPCVRVCLQLGDHRIAKRGSHEDPNPTKALELYGVAFRCVTQDQGLVKEMVRLLGMVHDALTIAEDVASRIDGIKGIEGIEGCRGIKGIEGIDDCRDTEGTKDCRDTEGTEDCRDTEGTKDYRDTEGTDDCRDIKSTDDCRDTEGTDDCRGIDNPRSMLKMLHRDLLRLCVQEQQLPLQT